MRNSVHCLLAASIFAGLAFAPASHADLVVGDYRGSEPASIGPLLRFGDSQHDNQAPLAQMTTETPGNHLLTPLHMTYEPSEKLLYVSDYYGQAIKVYPANASGDTLPLRVLNPPIMGQPRQTAIDLVHDELISIVGNCCIASYPRNASGNAVATLRYIQWGGGSGSLTRLNNPVHLALRALSDELIVTDYQTSTSSGVILFFPRTSNGNVAPVRSIEGGDTLLSGAFVAGMAYDAVRDEIVAVAVNGSVYRIITYAGTASGNASPLRVIEGSNTTMENVAGMAVDPAADQIYVASGSYNSSAPAVLVFPRSGNGNVAPIRRLAGNLTGLTAPYSIVVTNVDRIFRTGQE